MINDNKNLYIGVVSYTFRRAKMILDRLIEISDGEVKSYNKNCGILKIDNCVYKIINKNESRMCGYKNIDQLIFDYALDFNIAKELLRDSCVPENFQIIDDRKIL